ncbi:DNA-binding transcriptional LysR family regulator [Haloactinospora alba]|uniref:DNA-binding transcriptional LysR family regulator n=1 Tax=Haloactinospora alba TaxID=405555 RepID=A0A543NNE8_9ACTN|nr:LysR substrate-binding domain-containing protein [Haloactinospora alba]TQN33352.1 DNA-binding transcriptional LysR family regulator [Haloactinospora alba]
MDQQELAAFLTLAEELHFRRTAERLHLTPGRVSQTIKKLERCIGAPLFERTSRSVRLTPLGEQLRTGVEPAHRRIREEVERATAAARGTTGTLDVGFVGATAGRVLLDVVDRLRCCHPGCEVRIREKQLGNLLWPLRSDEVDILLTQFPVREDDLTTGPVVIRESPALAVPAGHLLAQRASVTTEDLAGTTVLSVTGAPDYWVDHLIPPHTPSGRAVHRTETTTFQETLALVGAGRGVRPVGAASCQYYARPDVAYVPFTDAPPLEFGPVWRTSNENARVRAFASATRAFLDSRSGPVTF